LPAYPVTALPAEATVPLDLIAEAVAAAGAGERRRRLLPAVAAVVFTLGCALFYGEGYGEVAAKLAGWLAPLAGPGGWHLPGTGALARARRRAGPGPLRELFTRLAGPLAGPGTPGAFAFGRLLAALDGTMLDVPCSPANAAAFGAPPSGSSGAGGFPQVRVVTLVACGTRGIMDAVFRGRRAPRASEQDLARKLAARGRCQRGMLVIADRNFGGYPVAAALAATGADLLIRVKSSQWLPVLEVLPDGSARSVLPRPAAGQRAAVARYHGRALPGPPAGLAVRLIEAEITITPDGGQHRTERVRLITTILDHQQAPAAAVAACYAQRWEVETGYREIKVFTRGAGQVMRSQTPAGIAQEIWALLCACQLTSAARARAAQTGDHDPDRIS
jgi:Insertion element 4 transposase N-terminal/Transposase DDE domain